MTCPLEDDPMVIVKGLLDADEHGQAGIDGERATLVVDDFGLVVS